MKSEDYYEKQRLQGNTDDITSNPNPDYKDRFYSEIFDLMDGFASLKVAESTLPNVENWDEAKQKAKDSIYNFTDFQLNVFEFLKQHYSAPVSASEQKPDGWVCNNVFVPLRSHFNDWQYDNAQPVYFSPPTKQGK